MNIQKILSCSIVCSIILICAIIAHGLMLKNKVQIPRFDSRKLFAKLDNTSQPQTRYKTYIKNKIIYRVDDTKLGLTFTPPTKGVKWVSKPIEE